jgi:beta-glucuronidase
MTRRISLFDPDYRKAFEGSPITAESLIDAGGRPLTPLDGEWRFQIDPYDWNRRRAAMNPQHFEAFSLPDDEALSSASADLPAGAWLSAEVPGCWDAQFPELHHYEGCVLYVREFEAPPTGRRYFLRIGAANYESTLWLNGIFLGRHEGGFTPFCIDVTERLQPRNVLAIVVDNRREKEQVPGLSYDWFNHGGIFRSVGLVGLPARHIKRWLLRLVPGTGFRRLRLDVETSAETGEEAMLRIPALGVEQRVAVDERGCASLEFDAEPELWSPERPRLYEIEMALESGDRVEDRVGFREVRVEGTKIVLNGQPVFLRGICAHEEFRGRARAAREEDTRQMLQDARELGCNFVRLAHYPHHENAARLADEVGMLLWEEMPVYWHLAFDRQATLANATNQLSELILRDRNRASVVTWSIANETPPSDERLAFLAELAAHVRALDTTRLISAALLPFPEDPLIQHLDIIGINEYFGWYSGHVEQVEGVLARLEQAGKPVIISEFGADCVAGLHGDKDEIRTEEFQADFYRRQFESVLRFPFIAGTSPWVLYDFQSPLRQNKYQRGYNRKGLIADDHRTRKQAFGTVHAVYEGLTSGGRPTS